VSGVSLSLVDKLSSRFLQTLNESSYSANYYQAAANSLCSIGLWVFVEGNTIPESTLGKVSLSTTGFGLGGTGNKGAVGARLAIDRGQGSGESRWETFT